MNSRPELTENWKALVGNHSRLAWEDEVECGRLFQEFRPLGVGSEVIFRGIAHADEMIARTLEVYRVSVPTWRRGIVPHWGCEPPLDESSAIRLCQQYFDKLKQIAAALNRDDIRQALERFTRFEIVRGHRPDEAEDSDDDSLVMLIYDAIVDFTSALKVPDRTATQLEIPLQNLVGRFEVSLHILWPLYRS